MNCREHREFFSDLYDGNLPADRRRDLEAHLASCAPCRTEYEDFSASLHALREGSVHVPGEAFVRRIVDTARSETERIALFQNTGVRRPATRRMTAPRRPLWAIPAVAAAALGAFAIGFLAQKHAADQEIRLLQDQIGRLENRPIPRNPDEDRPELTNQQIIDAFTKQENLVQVDGVWMAADIRDRLNRGEMKLDGKWVDANREIERQVAELAKATPGAPDLKALEERVLQKNDLVRRGDWIMPRRWAEALEAGNVLDGAGEPRDLAGLVADKLRELGLVEHDGRWMRPEQRTELLANRRIGRNDAAAPATAVTRALDGLEIGPPLGFRNLTIYPLSAPESRTVAVSTLAEAIAADRVEITDVDALQVRVRNRGDAPLAVLAGEILIGGRHARVVARDSIVPGGKDRNVDVFDAEPAELRAADKIAFRRESGHYWAPLGMRRLLNEETGQGGIWASMFASGSRASTADLYREHRAALSEFRAALIELRAAHPAMTGVGIAVGDSIAAVEVFGSPSLLAAHFDRVVESAAIESIVTNQRETRFPSDLPAGPLGVRRLAESAFTADQEVEGDAIAVHRNRRTLGRALVANGEAVRVLLFPEAALPIRPSTDLAVKDAKIAHVLKAYDARLQQSNGSRKAALLREMALLPGDRARAAVVAQAGPGSPYRRDAIEALGLRGDPAVADQLIKWLKESRKDVPVYTALAQSLARLGSEEAIPVLIGDIDPKAPQARIAAEQASLLLSGIRNVNTLETQMGTYIGAMIRIPVEPGAEPQGSWIVKGLRLATGKSFAGPGDYHLWWNNPVFREEFLELRRK